MAITAIETIKSWFRTDLYPTQAQFYALFDSYWHKNEIIPQDSIEGLADALSQKAEGSQFTTHLTDPDAHQELFEALANGIALSVNYVGTSLQFVNEAGDVLYSTTASIENIAGLTEALSNYKNREIKEVTDAEYTLLADDWNKKLQFKSAANQIVYVPTDWPRYVFECVQMGTGSVKVVPAAGSPITILTTADEEAKTVRPYSVFTIEWADTNEYLVYGKLNLL